MSQNSPQADYRKVTHNPETAEKYRDLIVIDKQLIEGLSEKEVELEHLKTVIVGLNEKLKVKEDIERDLENEKKVNAEHSKAREELHRQLEEAARKAIEEADKNKRFQDIILKENEDKDERIRDHLKTIDVKNEQIEKEKNEVSKAKRENNELEHRLADMEEIKRQNEQYKRDILAE